MAKIRRRRTKKRSRRRGRTPRGNCGCHKGGGPTDRLISAEDGVGHKARTYETDTPEEKKLREQMAHDKKDKEEKKERMSKAKSKPIRRGMWSKNGGGGGFFCPEGYTPPTGSELDKGHLLGDCKDKAGKWYKFDDASKKLIPLQWANAGGETGNAPEGAAEGDDPTTGAVVGAVAETKDAPEGASEGGWLARIGGGLRNIIGGKRRRRRTRRKRKSRKTKGKKKRSRKRKSRKKRKTRRRRK